MSDLAYPLKWPSSYQRTARPTASRFNTSMGNARGSLLHEIKLMGGRYVTISSNVPLRQDGLPYASFKEPSDHGVAVYFEMNGQRICMACDKWDKVAHNVHALAKSIAALRGLDRWGCSDILNRAFDGFKALPEQSTANVGDNTGSVEWWLKVFNEKTPEDAKRLYRHAVKIHHPDHDGDSVVFNQLKTAWQQYNNLKG